MRMPLYLLTPRKLESEEWALSTHMCPVQVKADDEIQARYRAATHFDTGRRAAGLTRPWLKVDLASVHEVAEIDAQIPYIEAHARSRLLRRRSFKDAEPKPVQQEALPLWVPQPGR